MSDLYSKLGVVKDSTKEAIKKGYRKMAKFHHPDKGGNAKKFAEVSLAYNILHNDEKRKQYDETGKIPNDRPDNFYAKFGELLSKEFIPLILKSDDIARIDIIDMFKKWVCHNLENFETKSSEIDKHIHKLNKSLKRVKRKKKQKVAIIEMTIESSISMLENHKIKLQEEITFFKKIYDTANNYSYDVDKTMNGIYTNIDPAVSGGDFSSFINNHFHNM